jgi:phosphotransferase system HPr (HPr) family protein
MGALAEDTVVVKNRLGLHLRAASMIAETIRRFDATVVLWREGLHADARSVTSMLILGAPQGTKLAIKADGPEAGAALAAIKELFEQRFGEE